MSDFILTMAAAAHPAGAEHAQPSVFGMGPGSWVAIAMLLLIGIMLWKKVPAMIGGMLDNRIAHIRAQLDEAATLRKEAEALRAEYQSKLTALEGEAAAMRQRAEQEATLVVARAKEETEQLITRRQRLAEERISAAERAAVAEVRAKAVSAAVAAAGDVIATNHGASADKALVEQGIAELGKL